MCKPNEQSLELQKTREAPLQVREEETIRQHLSTLQTWEGTEGATLEEQRKIFSDQMIQRQQERASRVLQQQAQQNLNHLEPREAAPGEPVQIQPPESDKEKRERLRRERKAKKKNPAADHLSYGMVESLQSYQEYHANSFPKKLLHQAVEERVDTRVLRAYVHGHRKNRLGRPLTPQDRNYRDMDQRFLDDYISKDLTRRQPHLDRMKEEVLAMNFSMDMFTPEYMSRRAGRLHEMVTKLIYFQNVMNDPINKPYFENLPQYEKDLLNSQVLERYAQLGTLLVTQGNAKGVDVDGAQYAKFKSAADADIYGGTLPVYSDAAAQALETSKQLADTAAREEMERRREREAAIMQQDAEKMKVQAETLKGQDIGGLNLTSFVTGYSFDNMRDARRLIESNPEEYARNRELVDKLYQRYYRGIDSLGDYNLKLMSAQGVVDGIPLRCSAREQQVKRAASVYLESLNRSAAKLQDEASSCLEALKHILKHKDISDATAELLRELRGEANDANEAGE